MHPTQWSPERPLPPPVSLASQSHHEKPPEVTCTSRGLTTSQSLSFLYLLTHSGNISEHLLHGRYQTGMNSADILFALKEHMVQWPR